MGFYNQLIKFLQQAKTESLKTKHFISEYLGTKVVVSFGQGSIANVPWISFLKSPNTTQKGIYPAYLYFKEFEILVLAYGISETNKSPSSWNLHDVKTIKEYFEDNYSKEPYRYGTSFVYKVYDINNLPNEQIMNDHLNSLINEYLEIDNTLFSTISLNFEINLFDKSIRKSGLNFSNLLITRFCASLMTKPFVILTGLSGSGKTKLAQAFVQWICNDKSQYKIVPVGADWTNREPLLGYPNSLDTENYVMPDSGVLNLILNAISNPDLPYFLILDEMNLSHVERYFADFLSVMESKEEILLHSLGDVVENVPEKIKILSNLFIIGTVNIDETTNMFSPKVLDRANTIEFRISQEDMSEFLNTKIELNMDLLNSKGNKMAKSFLEMSENKSFALEESEQINETFLKFFKELKSLGAEFGYRGATEMIRLINQLTILDSTLTTSEKLDIAIVQKLLPKLHGSRRKLCPVLATLGKLCIIGDVKIETEVFSNETFDYTTENVLYPITLEKLARMYRSAIDNGFTSFAEA